MENIRKTCQFLLFICTLQCLFGAFFITGFISETWWNTGEKIGLWCCKNIGKHVSLFINYNAYLEPFLKLTLLVRPVGTPGKKSASGVVKKIGKHVGSNVYL
jgi:hypothetical protein